jgi:hypothetical protein
MIDYIFKRSEGQCRILIVYNGAHDNDHSVRGKYAEGARDADKAISAAVRIGVPPGVMISGDVEGAWQPSADWFRSWAETMYKSRYAGMGGIYCRPNIPQFYNPYTEAVKRTGLGHMSLPMHPLAKKPKDVWMDVILPEPPDKMRLLWGTRPQQRKWSEPSKDKFVFAPAEPPQLPGRVALWQYHIDFLKQSSTSKYGLIDMDLADERAYARMWDANSRPGAGLSRGGMIAVPVL